MFYKMLLIVVLIAIKVFSQSLQQSSQQLVQSIDENVDQNSDNKSNNDINTDFTTTQSKSDLKAINTKNNSNETLINKTNIESIVLVNDLPPVPTPSVPNDMLSFEEWRKKIAEKSVQNDKPVPKLLSPQVIQQTIQSVPPVVQTSMTTKQKTNNKRSRNFGSHECGAKVVDSNPESESIQRILNEATDEYMLNPCKAKIWFVIELCETIQPKSIEIANFELYSSVPKEFNIQASDHYPTRDWSSLGTFSALDERSVQRFQLQDNGFVKFIKIEMLSHYGSEHFCPTSVVRIFGTSLFEEVERIDNLGENHNQISNTDEDNESPITEELVGEEQSSQNLFGTARDAVFNIVRKAAQALNGNNEILVEIGSNKSDSSDMSALMDTNAMAMRLYSNVNKYLINCNKTSNNLNNCLYLKSIFGQTLYDLLIERYLSLNAEKSLLFQCDSQQKNSTNESIIESIVENENFEFISPTKPVLNEIHSQFVGNMSSDSGSVINISEELQINVTQTQTPENMFTSSESSVLSTLSSESSVSEDRSEELSSNQVINNNKVLNESEIIGIRSEDSAKDVYNNDITAPIGTQSTTQTQNGNNGYITSGSTGGQSKESVVIRLSNRIKALEVNLSLSSQYLEELSLRYRKQMEEMQRAFNITISKLNDTNIRATERDLKQQESIALLETKLNSLNTEMSVLLRERESLNWHYIEVHITLMMIEVIVVITFLFICVNRLSKRIQFIQSFNDMKPKTQINSVSPNKRSHPNINPCHLPLKTIKIEDENKSIDCLNNNNKTQRKIRKKKKKTNVFNDLNSIQTNCKEKDVLVSEHTNSQIKCYKEDNNQSLISKSHSTPDLPIIPLVRSNANQTVSAGIITSLSNCSSIHSSTSGVLSSNSTLSLLTPKQSETKVNDFNKNSLNYCKKQKAKQNSDFKSNSLALSLKKLLKFERK